MIYELLFQNNSETVASFFLIGVTSCWNGISLACMDVAKKHVTRKSHADAGKRICDYPIIQVNQIKNNDITMVDRYSLIRKTQARV